MYIKYIYFFQGEVTSCLYEIKPGCPGQVVKNRTFGHGNRPDFTHLRLRKEPSFRWNWVTLKRRDEQRSQSRLACWLFNYTEISTAKFSSAASSARTSRLLLVLVWASRDFSRQILCILGVNCTRSKKACAWNVANLSVCFCFYHPAAY